MFYCDYFFINLHRIGYFVILFVYKRYWPKWGYKQIKNSKHMTVKVKTFQCGCGDCIFFIIDGEENHFVMMIDCGNFTSEIKDFITETLVSHIDLLVVTHIDADHILGLRDMLTELPELKIEELWFNSYPRPDGNELSMTDRQKTILERLYASKPAIMDIINVKVSTQQAITLSEAILNHQSAKNAWKRERIDTDKRVYAIKDGRYGKITILSPNKKQLEVMDEKFKSLFFEFFHKEHPDVPLEKDETLFELLQLLANELEQLEDLEGVKVAYEILSKESLTEASDHKVLKSTCANEASIAFVWELQEHKILFLGDASPKIVTESVKKHYGEGITQFDIVKVSHHGSAHGTSNELMSLINAQHFIFTGGEEDTRPHINAIARIIIPQLSNGVEKRLLHFNYQNSWTDGLKENVALQEELHYTVDTDNEIAYEL